MSMKEQDKDPIPEEFESLEKAGEFWDTHSATDYWDEMEDAALEVNLKGTGSQMEEYAMISSTIGRQGQMTVPQEIRNSLNLQEGDRLVFIRRGNEVVLQPLTKTLLDLRGSIPADEQQDFVAIRDQVVKEHARKVAQSEA